VGRFIVREVRLSEFLSHRQSRVAFTDGITALIGENGAGKTSIIEAINLVMTRKPLRTTGRSLQALIRYGSNKASVTVVFEDPETGEQVIAQVRIPAKGSGDWRLMKRTPQGELQVVSQGATSYINAIREILGVSAPHSQGQAQDTKIITYAVLVGQGRLQAIAESLNKPAELRRLVEEAVGIPEYRKAVENLAKTTLHLRAPDNTPVMAKLAPTTRTISQRLRQLRKDKASIESELRAKQDEKRKLETREIPGLEQELENIEQKIQHVMKEQDRLSKEKATLESQLKIAQTLRETLDTLENQAQEKRKLLEEAEKAREELPRLEAQAGALELVDEARKKLDEKKSLQEALEKAEKALKALREEASLRVYEEKKKQAEEKKKEVEAEKSRIEEQLRQVQVRKEVLDSLYQQIQSHVQKLKKLVPTLESQDIIQLVEEARKARERIEGKIAQLEEEIEGLKAQKQSLLAKKKEAEKALQALASSSESKCPVCGSPLTPERRQKLEEYLRKAVEDAERAIQELDKKIRSLERDKKKLEKLEKNLSNILGLIQPLLEEYSGEEHEKARRDVESLERRVEALDSEISRLEEEIREAGKHVTRLFEVRGELKTLGYMGRPIEEVEAEASRLSDEIERLEGEIIGILAKIEQTVGTRDLEEARKRAVNAKERLGKAKHLAGKVEALRKELEQVETQIGEIQSQLEQLQDVESKLDEVEKELAELSKMKGDLDREHLDIVKSLAELRARLQTVEKEIESLRGRLEAYKRLDQLYRTAVAVKIMLEELQERLAEEAVDRLKAQMTDIINLFDLDYTAVEIRREGDGYDLALVSRFRHQPGGHTTVRVGQLSGGEKTAVALAFVLALNRILTGRIGFMVLDEPTAELDVERRRQLVGLLRKAVDEVGLRQLIVVTHHDEITDQADTVCRVVKEEGVSRVEGCG